jgi:hypothetical protein
MLDYIHYVRRQPRIFEGTDLGITTLVVVRGRGGFTFEFSAELTSSQHAARRRSFDTRPNRSTPWLTNCPIHAPSRVIST